jgi:predicted transcriptional regulator
MTAAGLSIIEVAHELQEPLADLARTLDQSPTRIVNQALAEFLERRLRPDRNTGGSTSSYIEMTAREEHQDVF